MIKCGHCKKHHETVDDVRVCAGIDPRPVNSDKSSRFSAPAGYYATPSITGSNDLDFWKIDRPQEGRWAGYVFVKRVVGGQAPFRISRSQQDSAIKAIGQIGIEVGQLLYARELGRCSKCGRHLTDALSRQAGKGPECRSKAS